jgi:glycosyltransferase involved in cell wall biosynthesis
MPLSVLQFAAGMPNWGGAEIHLLNLSEQLRRRGHDVTIACQPDRYVEAEAQKRGFATIPITLTRQHDRRDLLHLCRYLRGHPTDVLHAHAPNDFLLPPLTALIAGVPVRLMTRHFPHSLRNRPGAWIYSNLLFSRIVTVSESVRQTLIASGMTQNRVETIYHGTDVKEFAATTQTPKESRRLLGISEGTVAVGIIGRIAEEKGHQFVLEAMRLIGKNFPVHLVIIGDGPQEETMKNLVREGDLCDQCLGYRGGSFHVGRTMFRRCAAGNGAGQECDWDTYRWNPGDDCRRRDRTACSSRRFPKFSRRHRAACGEFKFAESDGRCWPKARGGTVFPDGDDR